MFQFVLSPVKKELKLDVLGNGIIPDLIRSLMSTFTSLPDDPVVKDFQKCLPQPRLPNYHIYWLICELIIKRGLGWVAPNESNYTNISVLGMYFCWEIKPTK